MRFRDLPRFPCYPDKRPACKEWPHDASADPARVAAMWNGRVGLLIAVPTGEASGLAVLDIDLDGMEWLAAHRDQLPLTREHETRSGGRHLVYRHREGLRNSAKSIAPGVDVRAEGGYAVWWPAHGFAVEREAVLADWPDWLVPIGDREKENRQPFQKEDSEGLGRLVREWRRTVPLGCREHRYAVGTLFKKWQEISAMPRQEGSGRGVALYRAAITAGGMMARGWLDADYVVKSLEAAAGNCGRTLTVGREAVRRELYRGIVEGLSHPYPDPADPLRKVVGSPSPKSGR